MLAFSLFPLPLNMFSPRQCETFRNLLSLLCPSDRLTQFHFWIFSSVAFCPKRQRACREKLTFSDTRLEKGEEKHIRAVLVSSHFVF